MLEGFLAPRSVAVVGAAREEGKVGHFVFDNLLAAGFAGPVYPVNPKADEIHGHRCYASLADVPGEVDLAVVVVPPGAVARVIEECGRIGCHAAIVITAGFKETGREGAQLERAVVEAARAGKVRILGPNCLGLIATPAKLDASFAGIMPAPGGIAFMSQSGALGTAILDWAAGEDIGLAYFASLGNKADVSEVDFIQAWAQDPQADVVVAYLESVAHGADFVERASDLVARKPFVVVKSGGSEAGARAVSSHTGSLAGSEAAYDAAFRRAGVVRAHTVQELFDFAVAFARQPLPKGEGLAILTNAGGPAIMATDACERLGVGLASLDGDTIAALHAALPPAAALYNPVDVLGDADASRYRHAAELLAADPNVPRAPGDADTPGHDRDPRDGACGRRRRPDQRQDDARVLHGRGAGRGRPQGAEHRAGAALRVPRAGSSRARRHAALSSTPREAAAGAARARGGHEGGGGRDHARARARTALHHRGGRRSYRPCLRHHDAAR